ncbi:MAG: aminodeoxychorismate/anthranilate synthase component II [Gammaproteobacteria bacterium RIFCSPHIGHO2_12_FULL_35_23]|nr:MAG: aminodeoxychorismate/anthranilate synthase component II [Gammaproteobacteria bacterium RIFCSPHIGHO2_12_FULL_35_23]
MILLIDNYDSFTYNLYQLITQFYPQVKVVRNDQITLTEIEAMTPAGIVLSPGPGHPLQAGLCINLIQQFYQTIPILGVCLGHQAIACAFGGRVIAAPTIVHGKADSIFHASQGLMQNMPQPFKATRYHSLCVAKENLPNTLVITAENKEGLIMGLKHQRYPCYGIQFHPESILTEQGTLLIKNFLVYCKQLNKQLVVNP